MPSARVTLPACKQDLLLWLENNIVHGFLKYINENTTYTNHKPTLTQFKQLKMKDFMLTEVTRTAKYTEVYFDEFQKHY